MDCGKRGYPADPVRPGREESNAGRGDEGERGKSRLSALGSLCINCVCACVCMCVCVCVYVCEVRIFHYVTNTKCRQAVFTQSSGRC